MFPFNIKVVCKVAGLVAALSLVSSAENGRSPSPCSRDAATKVIAEVRRVVSPNGVERLQTLRIGGIDQWVSVRGTDRGNPVLLYVHGGPGYVSIPMSW
jgi:hypothetical protein